jgi:heme-degrading monooxygenase HmoA/GNAT superfamily N-acetyltransferase
MAERMIELASRQPGFLGVESARNPDGFGITVSYWTTPEAISDWKANIEHLAAQDLGKRLWYSNFELRVAKVERAYGKQATTAVIRKSKNPEYRLGSEILAIWKNPTNAPESLSSSTASLGVAGASFMDMQLHYGYLPGAIGRIVQLHASFYAEHSGFGVEFEAKVASELAAFCRRMNPVRDGIWLAVEANEILGSIVVDGANAEDKGAHLRWFIVSDKLRGSGAGNQLLRAAMDFCSDRQYRSVYLWTFDQLHAARHLYEKHGFKLTKEQLGNQWGKEVNEQLFVKSNT